MRSQFFRKFQPSYNMTMFERMWLLLELDMFVIKVGVWLNALVQFSPDILQVTQATVEARAIEGKFVRFGEVASEDIYVRSRDYHVKVSS